MEEAICSTCGGTVLSPTRGGVPRGSCHCPTNRGREEEMTEETKKDTPPKVLKPIGFEPEGEIKAVKAGTKLAALIDALARPEGATLEELATELSRSGSTVDASGVKSWMSYDLRRTGLGVRQDGDRLYLVGTPLPHREAGAKQAAPEAGLKIVAAEQKKKAAMRPAKGSKKPGKKAAAK